MTIVATYFEMLNFGPTLRIVNVLVLYLSSYYASKDIIPCAVRIYAEKRPRFFKIVSRRGDD